MPTNFDLAPPPRTVDGLLAVPLDIQHVQASLVFDGAASSGTGDATMQFVSGVQDGNAIFDLRQTLTGLWLDANPLATSKAAHHDFGGGSNAQLRVVESVLPAGTPHSLRVTYSLGAPQASGAGSYQPAMVWSPGPRLAFNFGFTDLGAGRYLEAWVPANLIYDQFSLDLDVHVVNTGIAHTVITNGAVTSLGPNHWSFSFPARFTALSPLLEVRAADTLASAADSLTLPVSGSAVTVQAWKLAASAVDLVAQIGNIKTWLAANEASTGPYLHGNRFVAFVNVGGMEYEGGTTSSPGSLRHETFHSWYGRGVKPAAQADGWWDEGWNVYNDMGASGSAPFDFTDAPVELSSRNAWVRITPPAAYSSGERFFEGVAAAVGVPALRSHMKAFYVGHRDRPVRTEDLEIHLVTRSGRRELVDAFHRFVYGFADPSPAPDLWIRDEPGDPGGNLWAGRFWDSPDLWIRNADDGGTTHQPPEHGQDNWFHARVRNRSASGAARHFLVTFNVKPWAGIEFVYPGDFLPSVAAAAGFELGAGQSVVVKARWPAALVPATGTHVCWLAAVLTRSDPPGSGLHVWEHNNLAQKNLTVVNAIPDSWLTVPFLVNRPVAGSRLPFGLELVRPAEMQELEASLVHRSEAVFTGVGSPIERVELPDPMRSLGRVPPPLADVDCGAGGDGLQGDADRGPVEAMSVLFGPGTSAFVPISVGPLEQSVLGLRLHVPAEAKPGSSFVVDLLKREEPRGRPIGGLAFEVRVQRR